MTTQHPQGVPATAPAIKTLRFGYGHSFWDIAAGMCRMGEPVSQILRRAHDLGYTNLTYRDIRIGLKSAPAALDLPISGISDLQKRYQHLTKDFNALEILKQLVLEARRRYATISDELDEIDSWQSMHPEMRGRLRELEHNEQYWFEQTLAAVKVMADIAVKLEGADHGQPVVVESTPEGIIEAERRLLEEIQQTIPPPPDRDLVDLFGRENIRPPVDETEGEVVTIDGSVTDYFDDED